MTDFERKLYQIFVNMRLYGKKPTLPELKRKTGKGEQEIREVTKSLIRKGALSWDKEMKIWIFKKPLLI
ncbi:hypothetical protein [Bacillus atrophaeus]|uniref:hypothetical protein n=1 Tax=Bacillus atrophaeus TaxID=1452 RepID=UPI002280E11B|nr:hypothetical protein [Bacillus atrophaeus]MCY8466047.1 hypothetical protein [Bacillus atrophaeus]MCY8478006.1 hypothetical protein [Bacillus atrophaeus]MCY8960433.1 hypothetical protein [Bacillus atrophaeus]MCY8962124.1 hypothetical protein [Bacillus atrophaeus]MCY9197961.1 hypothetical protein [Bacillus atrophaeus]